MRPLDGIIVLDMTRALSGPICAAILADYGAKVIKIETIDGNDTTRGKNYDPDLPEDRITGGDYFYSINRNKMGISLDSRSEEGKALLKKMAEKADVFISNFRPGITEKIGIDYESLKKVNPRIICCEINAFREKGRENEAAFDVVIQAASGILDSTGYPDEPPAKVGASMADMSGGLNAVQGILLALLAREKTGKGQYVNVRMQDAAMFMLAQYATPCCYLENYDLRRNGMSHAEATPSNGYETKDGYLLIAPASDSLFREFCNLLKMPEMVEDPRFSTGNARFHHRKELDEILIPIMKQKTKEEWHRIFSAEGIPASPIATAKEAFLKAKQDGSAIVAEVPYRGKGRSSIPVIGTVCELSDTPGRVDKGAPILGEHTREVLKDLAQLDDEAIDRLQSAGIICCYDVVNNDW